MKKFSVFHQYRVFRPNFLILVHPYIYLVLHIYVAFHLFYGLLGEKNSHFHLFFFHRHLNFDFFHSLVDFLNQLLVDFLIQDLLEHHSNFFYLLLDHSYDSKIYFSNTNLRISNTKLKISLTQN